MRGHLLLSYINPFNPDTLQQEMDDISNVLENADLGQYGLNLNS